MKLNQLYNISCEEGIARLKENNVKIDCIITSPPYNVNLGNNKYNKNPYDIYRDNKEHSEYINWLKDIFSSCHDIMKVGGSICINIGDGKNGCYDNNTEILTSSGWKLFKYLKYSDLVLTLNPSNHQMEWEHPSAIQQYPYDGEMFHYKTYTLDLMVTPNHYLYMENHHTKGWKKNQAQHCNQYQFYLPRTIGKWNGKKKEFIDIPEIYAHNKKNKIIIAKKLHMDTFLEFAGWYISEGCVNYDTKNRHRITISQSKKVHSSNYMDIIKCINKLGYNNSPSQERNIRIYNKQLCAYMEKHFGKYCENKTIPTHILELPTEQLKILFSSAMKGDGCYHCNGQLRYYTTSKKLADKMQELALKIGYTTRISIRKDKKHINKDGRIIQQKHPSYTLTFNKQERYNIDNQKSLNKVNYKGTVYCCSTSNGIIYVRRNGCSVWCGNSVPTHSDIIQFMTKELDYILIATIIWYKQQISNPCSWGSFLSPSCPSFPTPFEYILIFRYKEKKHIGNKIDITVTKEEFITNSRALWTFAPEMKMKQIGHPAAFPEELPYRLIQQLTYKNDTIMDPFSGAGTTALVAKKLERNYIGFELSPVYHNIALKRLEDK